MSRPKILVTGAAGYIGSVLCDYLLQTGCHVIAVDDLMYGEASKHAILGLLSRPHFEFHYHDVQNYVQIHRLLARADAVVPLAALVGAPACKQRPGYAIAVNQWAIADLVAHLSKKQRIVYPNTNSGYGITDGNKLYVETDHLRPISLYGVTKCNGEQSVLSHENSAVLRLATVFGVSPRMRFDLMVNNFVETLSREEQLVIFEPEFQRNFVGIRDVVRAFTFLLSQEWLTGVYNLGLPGANLTKLELAYAICDELGVNRKMVIVGDGEDPDKRNYLVSSQKICSAGFHYEHDLARGVREIANAVKLFTTQETKMMRNA